MSRSETEVRSSLLKVRLSPCERAHLVELARAAGQTVSDYARSSLIGPDICQSKGRRPATTAMGALIEALARIERSGRADPALLEELRQTVRALVPIVRSEVGLDP